MPLTIASWNVNSIKVRLPLLLDWLRRDAPDVVLLQEIKCQTDAFPGLEIAAEGYRWAAVGQKAYNGVAILSRQPMEVRCEVLTGEENDPQARYLEADIGDIRVACLYLPNGNPPDTPKFAYKLDWLARLHDRAAALLAEERPVVLGGDWNVIPEPIDCYDPAAWEGDALFRPETRAAFQRLCWLGYTDAFRALHPSERAYTFWDYQAGAWQADHGIRIDHLLLSPQAADRLEASGIEKSLRGREKASDHTPVWCRLA